MRKRMKLLCLVLLAAVIFAGCTARTMEEMYRLPKRSEDYTDLQKAIDSAMTDLDYCAPLAGENQQTVQLADLDGDGILSAAEALKILRYANGEINSLQ